ncbi:MAG: single-stranded-DNA-specific exonuclease RecJ [Firmicutes bacterium]|nr:single-stranded-DNA-specific exonuclease RecJ [Bacillota bacterium]
MRKIVQRKSTGSNKKPNSKALISLAQKYNFSALFTELLAVRGVDFNNLDKFLYPTYNDLNDPFLFKDMGAVVERLTHAINRRQAILIYGDYDVDGITATAILHNYLVSKSAKVVPYIPSRQTGYGFRVEPIKNLIKKHDVKLIITVDCGISDNAEIEKAQGLGLDVIITDHHSIPDVLPDCLIINPKVAGDYVDDTLCGAAVAFKVVQALILTEGKRDIARLQAELANYIEMAALACIADIVSLTGESRTIAKLGLEKMANNPSLPFKVFRRTLKIREYNSTSLAFNIAPKINAAGRVAQASEALKIFTTPNVEPEIEAVILKLIDYNHQRQNITTQIVDCSKAQLDADYLYNNRCIVLSGEWDGGVLGIIASRLTDEYTRPTVILSKDQTALTTNLTGSARSLDSIDMLEAFLQFENTFVKVGGHSKACGVTICDSKVTHFTKTFNDYLNTLPIEFFYKTQVFDLDITKKEVSLQFVKELELLEPFGLDNPRPQFLLNLKEAKAKRFKNASQHIKLTYKQHKGQKPVGKAEHLAVQKSAVEVVSAGQVVQSAGQKPAGQAELDVVGFSYANFLDAINSGEDISLILHLGIDNFTDLPIGHIRYIQVGSSRDTQKIIANYLERLFVYTRNLKRDESMARQQNLTAYKCAEKLAKKLVKNIYGTIFVASRPETYKNFLEIAVGHNILTEVFTQTDLNNYNRLVLAPSKSYDFSRYKNLVLLDNFFGTEEGRLFEFSGDVYVKDTGGKVKPKATQEKANTKATDINFLTKHLKTDRDTFAKYFSILKQSSHINFIDMYELFDLSIGQIKEQNNNHFKNVELSQFVFCLLTFLELGIFTLVKNNPLNINASEPQAATLFKLQLNNKNSSLENSAFYNAIKQGRL